VATPVAGIISTGTGNGRDGSSMEAGVAAGLLLPLPLLHAAAAAALLGAQHMNPVTKPDTLDFHRFKLFPMKDAAVFELEIPDVEKLPADDVDDPCC